MRRDEYYEPLHYFSILTMLAVKAFTVIVFVFVFLAAGLKYKTLELVNQPVNNVPVITEPLPDTSFGLSVMPTPMPTATVFIPTFTLIPTQAATNTSLPTDAPTVTSSPTQTITATLSEIATATSTFTITPTLRPSATPYPSLTPTNAGDPTQSLNNLIGFVASPLQGIPVSELPEIITQPFILPPEGEDSGHHGVDFAFWKRGDLASIEGLPILSVFPGKVISAYSKIRTPYGYMVIVETPLKNLPTEIVEAIKIPPTSSTPSSASNRLTCPSGFADWWSTTSKSLYVLYGHMAEIPSVSLGQTVKIGDVLGVVGNTGASSNPHLHFEMRIGPSDATFNSMGHYDTTTTEQERHNYCQWRISGQFDLFDPMILYGGSSN